jgi:hypothetical protein
MTQDEIIASNLSEVEKANERIKMLEDKLASIKQAIAELESQEPVAQPAQRTWVGLTKEDKDLIEDLCEMMIGDAAFSTIDAILKGKNT